LEKRGPTWRLVLLFFGLIAITSLYFFAPRKAVVVMGPSMEPTYHTGQIVVVDRMVKHLVTSEVAVFQDADCYIIKRVLASEGEHIYLQHVDADTWVPIEKKDYEAFMKMEKRREAKGLPSLSSDFRDAIVPKGQVYIGGDNTLQTIFGFRRLSQVYGKVVE
jgi:signal peptidase I